MPLVLVRHLAVAVEAGICYGCSEVPLSAASRAQLPAFAAGLLAKHGPFAAVFTSPRRRCSELAEIITPDCEVEPALAEMDFGLWEHQPWAEISRSALDAWAADPVGYAPGGGESLQRLAERVVPWLERIIVATQQRGQTTLAVTHGGPMRVAIALAQRLPLEKALDIAVPYGGAVTLGEEALREIRPFRQD